MTLEKKKSTNDEASIWLALAELFFLDTECGDGEYKAVADLIKQAGWSQDKVLDHLIKIIAPVAGRNIGYLIYPVIGEWDAFDPDQLTALCIKRQKKREKRPEWLFHLTDFYCKKMLKSLNVEKLLVLL